ncbi:ubiquitin-like-conjugating enzyme ATG10 [Anneissia japonica]|uniref:ubiquitin-like-conjugating enzyme ATG10 n=1 Tax=Anneissia japonica TaxID=1529436 RepID=UPI001425535C|nr:ubiquitin-like-conjugating enzyme ATG10 [Anneissia japonica]
MTLLAESEFKLCLKQFIDVSNEIKDTWEIVSLDEPHKHDERQEYMIKRNVSRLLECPQQSGVEDTVLQYDEGWTQETDEDDVMAEEQTTGGGILCTYEYHVVYSHSYAVPVLYFNACKPDGQLLSLDEVWEMIPDHYQTRLQHERWTFITQQEHPILGRPFFTLHPCHTADLMKTVLTNKTIRSSYLVSWLSSVGPVVGLELSLDYAKLCKD